MLVSGAVAYAATHPCGYAHDDAHDQPRALLHYASRMGRLSRAVAAPPPLALAWSQEAAQKEVDRVAMELSKIWLLYTAR